MLSVSLFTTFRAQAPEYYVHAVDGEASGVYRAEGFRHRQVEDLSASAAGEMAVARLWCEVVDARSASDFEFPHESAFYECVERIVYSGTRQ